MFTASCTAFSYFNPGLTEHGAQLPHRPKPLLLSSWWEGTFWETDEVKEPAEVAESSFGISRNETKTTGTAG